MDRLVVVDEVCREARFRGGVAVVIRPQILGIGLGPLRTDGRPDTLDAVRFGKFGPMLGIAAHQQILGQVDVKTLNRIDP